MQPIKRINAWSSPRNISTALMYSFAQRKDTTVVDEPLYAHYLKQQRTPIVHPATAEVLKSQEQDGNKVVQEIILGPYSTPVVFFKQMTHHLIALDEAFLSYTDHIMLIRPPRAIINSYIKVIPSPSILDVGVKQQFHLYQKLKNLGKLAAIVDSEELLKKPTEILRQLCERLNIIYTPDMLQWEKGARPEDGVWAPYWYKSVHESTGFMPYQEREIKLPDHAETLAEKCQPYYDALLQHALKV